MPDVWADQGGAQRNSIAGSMPALMTLGQRHTAKARLIVVQSLGILDPELAALAGAPWLGNGCDRLGKRLSCSQCGARDADLSSAAPTLENAPPLADGLHCSGRRGAR